MGLHAERASFWDEALNGKIQILDYAESDYPDLSSIRAAVYREATNRHVKAQTVVHDEHHLVVAAFGGMSGLPKIPLRDLRQAVRGATHESSPATVRLGAGKGVAPERLLIPMARLPVIKPSLDDPLYTNPGAYWKDRVWEPAAAWVSPYKGDHPVGPQQCIWQPRNEMWDIEDLSWLQDRREAGTLYPWELRQGFCPPGTALSETRNLPHPHTGVKRPQPWVWQPLDWLELASERCYCTCDMRLDGTLVDPGDRDHFSDPDGNSCGYWTAPDPEEDIAAITPFMDPRAALVPGLMDEAEARMAQYDALKKQNDKIRGAW